MRNLQKKDFDVLKELFEKAHNRTIEQSWLDESMGGYFSGASVLYNFLEDTYRFGTELPTTLEDFIGRLRIPRDNLGVDNAPEILFKTSEVLQAEMDQLPKWAALKEMPLWKPSSGYQSLEFSRKTAYFRGMYAELSVPDYTIAAQWRLMLGF